MLSESRRHHYVPAFYLAQFTETRTQEGALWVFDGKEIRSWKSTPRTTGHERDFNRIDVPDVDPLGIEKDIFGKVEDLAAPVITRWCSRASGTLTVGVPSFAVTFEEFAAIVTFIAAQWIRVPRMRESIDRFHTQKARGLMEKTSKSKADFARTKAKNEHLRNVSWKDMRELLDDNFTVKINTAGYFQRLLPLMDPITDLLGARKWGIFLAPSGGPDFICCDDPVVLLPPGDGPSSSEVGFGTPGSAVCIPLSARHALWGTELVPGRRPILDVDVLLGTDQFVPMSNSLMIQHSSRFLYAGSADFSWLRDDDHIGDFEDLRKTKERSGRKGNAAKHR